MVLYCVDCTDPTLVAFLDELADQGPSLWAERTLGLRTDMDTVRMSPRAMARPRLRLRVRAVAG